MDRLKAVILAKSPDLVDYVYTKEQIKHIGSICDLIPGVMNEDDVRAGKTADVEVIFSTWGMPSLSEDDLSKMPKLKGLFYAAGATDGFARPFFAKGIPVISAWRMNAIPVAEYCHAEIMLALKGFYRNIQCIRETHDWHKARPLAGPGAYGETIALIGAGAISTILKDMLEQHNLNVIVVPSRPERRTMTITEAFSKAFVISNHLPNRDDNVHVIGKAEFEAMRPGAVFINTGRGAQVDEAAMAEVFARRTDLTAILDVTEPEPPPADSPLYKLPNIWITSHIAGSINDEVHRMSDCVIGEFENYLAGKPFVHEVKEEMLLTAKK